MRITLVVLAVEYFDLFSYFSIPFLETRPVEGFQRGVFYLPGDIDPPKEGQVVSQ
jgi:hypothetical protein